MTQTYTPRRSAEQWQSLIDQWQSSGQSAKQFCKEQALGYASFCQCLNLRFEPALRYSALVLVSPQRSQQY